MIDGAILYLDRRKAIYNTTDSGTEIIYPSNVYKAMRQAPIVVEIANSGQAQILYMTATPSSDTIYISNISGELGDYKVTEDRPNVLQPVTT